MTAFEKDNKQAQLKMDFNLKKGGGISDSMLLKKIENNPNSRLNFQPGRDLLSHLSPQPAMFDRLKELYFDEVRFTSVMIKSFTAWVKNNPTLIRNLSFDNIKFEDKSNFKELCTAVSSLTKLMVFSLSNMVFENELYGKCIG